MTMRFRRQAHMCNGVAEDAVSARLQNDKLGLGSSKEAFYFIPCGKEVFIMYTWRGERQV